MGKQTITFRKSEYYNEIAFLRGFSIITIVLMHFMQNNELPSFFLNAISIGGTGVHVFFFCSGFGLFLSYIKHPSTYAEFIRKRFFKIYIPYIIIVVISACLPFMFDGNRIMALLSHVFLFKMFSSVYEDSFGVFWYISTLFQFYLIFIPLVKSMTACKNRKHFLMISVLISISWWIFSSYTGLADERIWGSFFLQYLWEFSLGMFIADYLSRGFEIKTNRIKLFLIFVFGIGMAGIAKLVGGIMTTFNDPFAFFGYGAFALLLYSYHGKLIDYVVYAISDISFELYLIHILIFCVVKNVAGNWWIAAVISIPVSILCAFALSCNRK